MTARDPFLPIAGGALAGLLLLAGAAHFTIRAAADKVRLNRTEIAPAELESLAPLLGAVPLTAPVQLVDPVLPAPAWSDLTLEPAPPAPRNSPARQWTVSAILISDSRRVAVINEQLVAVGAILPGGARLVAIERDHVVLDEPGRGRTVLRIIDR